MSDIAGSSNHSLLSAKNFTDLPASLQATIVKTISDEVRQPPIHISLKGAYQITAVLPVDLLSIAQSSRDLATVTAEALGARATYITRRIVQNDLSKWVSALSPFIKAVSTWTGHIDGVEDGNISKEQLCNEAVALLTALAGEDLALEVLDLKDLSFHKCADPKLDLEGRLVRVLEASSSSLRELALPVTNICAMALESVSLPGLEVAEFELQTEDSYGKIYTAEKGICAEATLHMLRALEGHADRSQKLTTVQELRLRYAVEAPKPDEAIATCSPDFFSTISRLKILGLKQAKLQEDEIAAFIALFPKLKYLEWNGLMAPRNVSVINEGCPCIEELHLMSDGYNPTSLGELNAGGELGSLNEVFEATQGKLRTLVLQIKLSQEQMKVLGENCSNLRQLGMEISRGDIGALATLLGTHCRQLRRLDLSVSSNDQCLGAEGWNAFSNAVRRASKELCALTLRIGDERNPMETDVESMVETMVCVLEFLGHRAIDVRFWVPTAVWEYKVLFDGVCRVMKTCSYHTKNLESLHADFVTVDWDYEWNSDEDAVEMSTLLLRTRDELFSAAPRLYSLFLGWLDHEARYRIPQMP